MSLASDFFSFDPVQPGAALYLESFGPYHAMAMAAICALGAGVIVFRKRLREGGAERLALIIATSIAIAFEAGLHICEYLERPYYAFIRGLIPFELCAVTLWLSVALCVSKNRTVFELLYFWGLGALAALLFANDDGAGPDKFRYYQYFGTHAYIVLTIVHFAAVRGCSIRLRSLAKAVGILFPITLAMRAFDVALAGPPYEFNYMFLLKPPEVSTPLDSFGGGWGYYFAFVGLCAAVMVAAYLPWPVARLVRSLARAAFSRSGRLEEEGGAQG
jgi:hypothetical integral membrane protein (TIGR02206 family)